MGLKSLFCVTHHLGLALSRLRSGAHGSQKIICLAARTFELENQSLALCQQFSTFVTPNLLQISHFDSPCSLHRPPASDNMIVPYPLGQSTSGGIAAGILLMSVVPWGAMPPGGALSGEGVRAPSPLPSEAFLKRNASGAYHDANQRRFPESSHAVQSIFSGAKFLCFSQLSRIIY